MGGGGLLGDLGGGGAPRGGRPVPPSSDVPSKTSAAAPALNAAGARSGDAAQPDKGALPSAECAAGPEGDVQIISAPLATAGAKAAAVDCSTAASPASGPAAEHDDSSDPEIIVDGPDEMDM